MPVDVNEIPDFASISCPAAARRSARPSGRHPTGRKNFIASVQQVVKLINRKGTNPPDSMEPTGLQSYESLPGRSPRRTRGVAGTAPEPVKPVNLRDVAREAGVS